MPYLAVVMPVIPEANKDEFLAAWPTIAAEMTALPMVLGVSGGPVVEEDGAAVTEFKFIQTIAFKTLEDEKAFVDSDFAKEGAKKYKSGATFECPDFPKDVTPKTFAQFSQMTGIDEAKGAEARKAWEDLMAILGKDSWGGKTVGDGPKAGMGLVGWDSLEEAEAAYKNPAAKAALDHYHSLGDCNGIIAKLDYFK